MHAHKYTHARYIHTLFRALASLTPVTGEIVGCSVFREYQDHSEN